MPWAYSLLSVTVVSLLSLVGLVTLSSNPPRVRRIARALVAFAVGTLLGDAFIHLLPETFGHAGHGALGPSLLVLGGILVFFLVEKLLRHHHGTFHEHHHEEPGGRPELAAINIIGDGIHNFIDGALIAASFLVSPALGLTTTMAVVFHEIPQELADFGILIHSGLTIRRAIALNLASASLAIVGAFVTLLAGGAFGPALTGALVPVTAGGFVYLAAADLIPELQHERGLGSFVRQGLLIAMGIALMSLLTLFE